MHNLVNLTHNHLIGKHMNHPTQLQQSLYLIYLFLIVKGMENMFIYTIY